MRCPKCNSKRYHLYRVCYGTLEYRCENCREEFDQESYIINKIPSCPNCGHKIRSVKDLKKLYKRKTTYDSRQVFQCKYCKKSFTISDYPRNRYNEELIDYILNCFAEGNKPKKILSRISRTKIGKNIKISKRTLYNIRDKYLKDYLSTYKPSVENLIKDLIEKKDVYEFNKEKLKNNPSDKERIKIDKKLQKEIKDIIIELKMNNLSKKMIDDLEKDIREVLDRGKSSPLDYFQKSE